MFDRDLISTGDCVIQWVIVPGTNAGPGVSTRQLVDARRGQLAPSGTAVNRPAGDWHRALIEITNTSACSFPGTTFSHAAL